MERETGFEPATSTLARLHSTTELLPQSSHVFTFHWLNCQAKFRIKIKQPLISDTSIILLQGCGIIKGGKPQGVVGHLKGSRQNLLDAALAGGAKKGGLTDGEGE